jgi:hypothetical protein
MNNRRNFLKLAGASFLGSLLPWKIAKTPPAPFLLRFNPGDYNLGRGTIFIAPIKETNTGLTYGPYKAVGKCSSFHLQVEADS